MSAIYLITIGSTKKAYANLKRLCRENGKIDHQYIKDNLPFTSGKLSIEKLEVDEGL